MIALELGNCNSVHCNEIIPEQLQETSSEYVFMHDDMRSKQKHDDIGVENVSPLSFYLSYSMQKNSFLGKPYLSLNTT
jgi:hypothetical protein